MGCSESTGTILQVARVQKLLGPTHTYMAILQFFPLYNNKKIRLKKYITACVSIYLLSFYRRPV
jgi:hypothetical protein